VLRIKQEKYRLILFGDNINGGFITRKYLSNMISNPSLGNNIYFLDAIFDPLNQHIVTVILGEYDGSGEYLCTNTISKRKDADALFINIGTPEYERIAIKRYVTLSHKPLLHQSEYHLCKKLLV